MAILDSTSLDPSQLIPILSAKFQEFDCTSPTVRPCTILRPVLEYLWAVHMKMVQPLVSSIEQSQDSQDWCAGMHFAHIMPSIADMPLPFLASPLLLALGAQPALDDLHILCDATECLQLREASNEENKKEVLGGREKIPEVVQKMIVKLSAIMDDVAPPGPFESYLHVLKQAKALGVAMVLNIEVSIRGCQVEVLTPMANAIKTGNFHANSLFVAHQFSIFNVSYIDAANMSSYNNTELDLLQSEGEGILKGMAKKFAENKFKHPEKYITYLTNLIIGMVLYKSVLENSLYFQRKQEHGPLMWTSTNHHVMHFQIRSSFWGETSGSRGLKLLPTM
jgi:hypothetical protein